MRVVIDNYHMGKHSGLLFGGTVIKEAESNEDYKWFTLSPKKFKGHWAYLNLSTEVKKHTSKLIKFVLQILELGKFQIRDFPFC